MDKVSLMEATTKVGKVLPELEELLPLIPERNEWNDVRGTDAVFIAWYVNGRKVGE